MTITLAELLKDSAYRLTQFKPSQIQALEASITIKDTGKTSSPYVSCLVRGKPIKLTPEEAVWPSTLTGSAQKMSLFTLPVTM